MKLIPILFSTPMVIAVNSGTKDVTRRTIKFTNTKADGTGLPGLKKPGTNEVVAFKDNILQWIPYSGAGWQPYPYVSDLCPYGKPGDVLWVRESFKIVPPNLLFYKADKENEALKGWKPSIHMPYDACRTWLEIVSVRPERLHDITVDDIQREGVTVPGKDGKVFWKLGEKNSALSFLPEGSLAKEAPPLSQEQVYRAHWAELWCAVNSRESYNANPWVWRVEFKPTTKPEVKL